MISRMTLSKSVNRRRFLKTSAGLPVFAASTRGAFADDPAAANPADNSLAEKKFFFTSQGKTALMNGDGSGLRYLTFDVPGQATWQPGAFFPDGKRVLILSMEPRRDGPGKPFDEYYQGIIHCWVKFFLIVLCL